jgi:hypothetical protein
MNWDEHYVNRTRISKEELAKHFGKHVAWSMDGKEILASGDDDQEVFNAVKAAGLDPEQVIFSYVAPPNEVSWGELGSGDHGGRDVRFRYVPGSAQAPLPSLGGVTVRHRPLVPIRIFGPAGSDLRDGLVDSGSDDTVFEERVAQAGAAASTRVESMARYPTNCRIGFPSGTSSIGRPS